MPSFSGTTPTNSVETQIINGPALGGLFGSSSVISSDGTTLFVSAGFADAQAGAVYVYTFLAGSWVQKQKIIASDAAATDLFGFNESSIALSSDGTTLIVGAYFEDSSPNIDNGAAYIFTLSAGVWTQQAKLLASDRADTDAFGYSVALSSDGNTAIVGAPFNDNVSPVRLECGAAYIFTRSGSTWTQQGKLTQPTLQADMLVGTSVALSPNGNTAYVGAPSDGVTGFNGSVYRFTRSAGVWTYNSLFSPSDSVADDRFGIYLKLSSDGTVLVIGNNTGNLSMYIFTGSGVSWTERQKVTSASYNNVSIASLSSDGSTILFGIPDYYYYTGDVFNSLGAADVYTRSGNTWSLQETLTPSDLINSINYGDSSLAISGDGSVAFVGARSKSSNLGAVYVYALGRALDNQLYSYNSTSGVWNVSAYGELQSSTTYATSTSGTWTVPVGAKAIEVTCIGGGGGGGAGARNNTAGAAQGGGAGGGGGGVSRYIFRAEDLGGVGAFITLTVAAGGLGAAATATGTTAAGGASGGGSGATTFDSYLYAGGGSGGSGGTTTTSSATGGTGGIGMYIGSSGLSSASTTISNTLPGAGGGGCGLGGTSTYRTGEVPTVSGLTAATTGTGPSDATLTWAGGGGAGGTVSTTFGGGGNSGGFPGGGGGGGGEGSTAGASGNGGAGGAGKVGSIKITVWYG